MMTSFQVTNDHFNPRMVTLARVSRGFTQSDLAEALGTSQSLVSKIEDGMSICPEPLLKKFTEVLHYPVSFFEQDWDIEGNPEQLFRRRKTIPKSIVNQALARITIRRNNIAELMRLVEHREVNLPEFHADDFADGIEEVARKTRVALRIPDGPIHKPIRFIERTGCVVILFDFETAKIDAFSTWADDIPVIFLNNRVVPSRQRFNLAHELGHLVMRHMATDEAEEEANAFASEFLAPVADMKHMITPLDINRLGQLKVHWKLSMRAIVYKAHQNGLITGYAYTKLMKQLNFRGLKEPFEDNLILDEPRLMAELVSILQSKRGFHLSDLARNTCLFEDEFASSFGESQRFRVVM